MNYRPEIDGLRALAVLPVIAFHAGVSAVPGGFIGVDIFFVISGFLITGIVAREYQNKSFSLLGFYERRIRRIMPALLLVILACLPLAWRFMVPYQLEDFSQSVIATLIFLSNALFWQESDYFAPEAETKPLLNTWSLAVEEQFYVLFPLLLLVLLRFGPKRTIGGLFGLTLISFALVLFHGQTRPAANFYLFPYRAWELLAGAIAAIWILHYPVKSRDIPAAIGLGMILFSILFFDREGLWPTYGTLVPVIGTLLVIFFAKDTSLVARVLSNPLFLGIGLISYSLYLWHWPLLAFLKITTFDEPGPILISATVLVSVLLAFLSWRFVEQPARNRSAVPFRNIVAVLVVACAPLVAFSIGGVQTAGYQNYKISKLSPIAAQLAIVREDEVAARTPVWAKGLGDAELAFSDLPKHRVLILGDSLSADLYMATGGHSKLFPETEFRRIRLDDRCMDVMIRNFDAAQSREGSGTSRCDKESRSLLESPLLDSADEIVLAANWQPETMDSGMRLAAMLRKSGKLVAISGIAAFNDMASLSMRAGRIEDELGAYLYQNLRSKFLRVNDALESFASEQDGVRFLDKLALFCSHEEESCALTDSNGRLIIFDNAHVTVSGVTVMAQNIQLGAWFK